MAFPFGLVAQEINEHNTKLIDEYIKSRIISEKEVIGSKVLNMVFSGCFLKVESGFVNIGGRNLCSDFILNMDKDRIQELDELTEDKDLPVLLSLVKAGFVLKEEAAAVQFETALNALYPVAKNDVSGIRHMKKDNQWIFIRGKFFDDNTAVVVSTNPDGVITKIEVKLSYKVG